MEVLEHPLLAEIPVLAEPCMDQSVDKTNNEVGVLSKTSISSHDFCNHSESFKKLVEMGLPCNESVEEKLHWLRLQIIGNEAEFDSPFGKRKVVYADHTASGRSLHYNENFIIKHLLPFYGMLFTSLHQATLNKCIHYLLLYQIINYHASLLTLTMSTSKLYLPFFLLCMEIKLLL